MRYRTETDSIGSREVPENAYYGIQSMRAAENFRMTVRLLWIRSREAQVLH